MTRISLVPVLILLLIIIAISACATPDKIVKVAKVQPLADLIGKENVQTAVLSPSGAAIGYSTKTALCIYKFDTQKADCYDWPNGSNLLLTNLVWSPDSLRLAFNEKDPLRYLQDSDIWVFDLASSTFTDFTDDHFTGSFMKVTETVNVDYLPMWDASGKSLYFFRVIVDKNSTYPLHLFHLTLADKTLVDIGDFSNTFPAMSVFQLTPYAFNGAASLSPNGKKVALSVRDLAKKPSRKGIWLIDLESGAATQLFAIGNGITAGIPDWETIKPFAIWSLAWTKDSEALVFIATAPADSSIPANAYYMGLKDTKITPLVDFTSIVSKEDFVKPDKDGIAPTNYVAINAAFMTDKNVLLLIGKSGPGRIFAIPSVPGLGPNKPAVLASIDNFAPLDMDTGSISSDGKALVAGYLITLEQK